jgi:hypothetical protein
MGPDERTYTYHADNWERAGREGLRAVARAYLLEPTARD